MVWFLDAFLKPKDFFASEKEKSDYLRAVFNYLAPTAALGVLLLLAGALLVPLLSQIPGISIAISAVLAFGLVFLIGMLLVTLVLGLFFTALLWGVSLLFGGKASFKQQYFVFSVFSLASVFLFIPEFILGFILLLVPNVGVYLYWALFAVYFILVVRSGVVALRETHEFSTLRALVSLAITYLIIAVVLFFLASALVSSMMGGVTPGVL